MSFVFFFFKQKTAYEMRISDWSSGVCSSDLANPQIVVDRPQISRNAAGEFAIAWESSGSSDLADTGVYLRLYSANGTAFGAATRIDGRLLRNPEVAEIGSASGRERVCQYV